MQIDSNLTAIGEQIEALALNDGSAWRQMAATLQRLALERAPGGDAGREALLALCGRAAERMACGGQGAAAWSMADALCAAIAAAGGGEDRGAVLEAGRRLERLLQQGVAAADGPPPAAGGVDPLPDLHRLMSLMIQLGPRDGPGLAQLADGLDALAGRLADGAAARQRIVEAARRVRRLQPDRTSAGDGTTLDVAGQLLEEAATMLDSDATNATGAGAPPLCAGEPEITDHMPQEVDPELMGEFITESSDLISHAEDALLSLENDPDDMEAVGTVFRAFHTVKGTAAFMDLKLIAEMGHHAESLLSRVREREIRYAGGYADLSLRSLDMLKTLVGATKEALGGAPLVKPVGYDALMEVLAEPEKFGVSEEGEEPCAPRLGDILVAQGKVQRQEVEQAASGAGEPLGKRLVEAKAASLEDVGQALRTQRRMAGKGQVVDNSIRVSTERLDRLIDMVGELVIAHSMVAQDEVVVNGARHDLIKKVGHTSKIVRELQDMSMSMRMVPLKATFNKMARLVRDLARKVGKHVQLVTEGEDTEIDRNLVDVISDPLVHMVRNAVDHGIEMPEVRERLGKPRSGVVRLCAYHSAGRVVVEIRDDGRGLDREAILAKARDRNLIPEGVALSDREIYNLIFLPGFSTAQVVTDVSGRGVGMDVVKRNIESLRGQAEIQSEPGRGSIFRISLPLTLAIIDGMVVRVGCERYVIPTVSIIRSIKPEPKDLSTVLGRGEMLQLQGKLIPLFRLADLFAVQGGAVALDQALVAVVEDDGQRAGLVIDELIGRQQVVIKTLGEAMQNLPGISGGAIMPNGRVGLILDIGGLVKYANAA
jgi:two-component system chemotaxis sensor kinase CheA